MAFIRYLYLKFAFVHLFLKLSVFFFWFAIGSVLTIEISYSFLFSSFVIQHTTHKDTCMVSSSTTPNTIWLLTNNKKKRELRHSWRLEVNEEKSDRTRMEKLFDSEQLFLAHSISMSIIVCLLWFRKEPHMTWNIFEDWFSVYLILVVTGLQVSLTQPIEFNLKQKQNNMIRPVLRHVCVCFIVWQIFRNTRRNIRYTS